MFPPLSFVARSLRQRGLYDSHQKTTVPRARVLAFCSGFRRWNRQPYWRRERSPSPYQGTSLAPRLARARHLGALRALSYRLTWGPMVNPNRRVFLCSSFSRHTDG